MGTAGPDFFTNSSLLFGLPFMELCILALTRRLSRLMNVIDASIVDSRGVEDEESRDTSLMPLANKAAS
jgi:hypothetical protein